jgi:hypothetical protein
VSVVKFGIGQVILCLWMSLKRLFLFQILCQTYFACKFIHCFVSVQISGLCVGRALLFSFVLGPDIL